MQIDLIRFAGNFSFTETALQRVGRGDVISGVVAPEDLKKARRPVLAIPAGGVWNFTRDVSDRETSGYEMIETALGRIPADASFDICIDCAGEGFVFHGDEHDLMSERFSAWGLDPRRVYLLTSRIDPAPMYLAWCDATGRKPILTPVYSPAQLYFVAGEYRDTITYDFLVRLVGERSPDFGRKRPKKFLCLNYSPREARWATMLHLMSEDLLALGLYSFYGRSVDHGPLDPGPSMNDVEAQLKPLKLPEPQLALASKLDSLSPLTLDDPTNSRMEKAYGKALQPYYAETYFSIVTESDFIAQAGCRFTEKVLKPMVNLHPFVVVGTPGILAELRRLGFKTFAPHIDESYDSIQDPAERLKAALASATALIRMPIDDLHELYAELWPILTHNFMHLLGGAANLVDHDAGLRALSRNGSYRG